MIQKMMIAVIVALLAQPAHASKPAPKEVKLPEELVQRMIAPPGTGQNCALQQQVAIGVNFMITAKSLAEAKAKFDEKTKQIEEFAAQQKIDSLELQSMSYNINVPVSAPDMEGKIYQLSGSAQYQLKSPEAAFKLAEFFEKQRFGVNINSNTYRAYCPTVTP